MKNGKFYESEFEKGFCALVEQAGWSYTHGSELNRLTSETLYEADLRSYL